jgi:hypothetical protein
MPHVDRYPAVDGDMVADRQPGTVLDEDAHGHGVAEHGEPVAEGSVPSNVEPDPPPNIRKLAEPRRGELGAHVSATNLHEKTHGVKKSKISLHGISHDHLCPVVICQVVIMRRTYLQDLSRRAGTGGISPKHLAFQQQISFLNEKDFRCRGSKHRNCG